MLSILHVNFQYEIIILAILGKRLDCLTYVKIDCIVVLCNEADLYLDVR